jgi:aminopeptidase N
MRDSFAMDNNTRHADQKKAPFIKLSRIGFFLLIAIFLCSLVAVALLVYNFTVCPQDDPQVSANHFHVRDQLISPAHPLTTSTQSPENATKHAKELRLPRSIKPISYDVVLLPFLNNDNFTFNGEIAIKLLIAETCKNVTLHSLTLKFNWNYSYIQKLDDDDKSEGNVSITSQYFVEEKQFLVLETAKELEKDSIYVVRLQFSGSIKDNLQGFYKSSYNVGTETRWIASTQFQATGARRFVINFHRKISHK